MKVPRLCWGWVCVGVVGVLLPIVSSFVTYTFVALSSEALSVDETGAVIIMLTMIKLLLLSAQGIFPIDLNKLFYDIITKGKRSIRKNNHNASLYQVPEVQHTPCLRRFLCEMEVIARTSDNYLPKEPKEVNGRILEEEVAPEDVDPIEEMQIEAIRALYRESDPTGELSAKGRRALAVVEGLTGSACETAYRLCPGRFTIPMLYHTVFDEINLVIRDHD